MGFVAILITLLVVVVVIAAVWTFAARRGSRMPEREPHKHDQGVRGT